MHKYAFPISQLSTLLVQLVQLVQVLLCVRARKKGRQVCCHAMTTITFMRERT
jgi:hypothetical protein